MAVDLNAIVRLGHLDVVEQRIKAELDKISIGGSSASSCSTSCNPPMAIAQNTINVYGLGSIGGGSSSGGVTYKAADKSVGIDNDEIKVNVSTAANNALTLGSDGLFVDVSNKVDKDGDKVLSSNDFTNAEKAKLAGLSTALADYSIASDAKVDAMLDRIFGTTGDVPTGSGIAPDEQIDDMLDNIFGK